MNSAAIFCLVWALALALWFIFVLYTHRIVARQIELVHALRRELIIYAFREISGWEDRVDWLTHLQPTHEFIRIGWPFQRDYREQVTGKYKNDFWSWKASMECWRLDEAEKAYV